MKSRREIKQGAKRQIRGSIFMLFLISLLWMLLTTALVGGSMFLLGRGVFNSIIAVDWEAIGLNWQLWLETLANLAVDIAAMLSVTLGVTWILSMLLGAFREWSVTANLNRMYNGKKAGFGAGFSGFARPWSAFSTSFMRGLFMFLWMLIPIVGFIIVIVKTYSYACAMYVRQDDGGGAVGAITTSRRLMAGRKWKLFVQDLSFIGWFLLSILTLGILFIWTIPYYNQARYNFYKAAKEAGPIGRR